MVALLALLALCFAPTAAQAQAPIPALLLGGESGGVVDFSLDSNLKLVEMNGAAYFVAYDAAHGYELWRSDVDSPSATRITDINPGERSALDPYSTQLFAFDNTLYFTADNGTLGSELWRSDGTAAGTQLVKDLNPGSGSSWVEAFTVLDGALYLTTGTPDVPFYQLWRTDGSEAGTVAVPYTNSPRSATSLTLFKDAFYFIGDSGTQQGLWRSDGSVEGTTFVASLSAPGLDQIPFDCRWAHSTQVVGDLLFFTLEQNGCNDDVDDDTLYLWRTDGTTAGTLPLQSFVDFDPQDSVVCLPDQLVGLGSLLYFQAYDKDHGCDLWQSDGTTQGTKLALDVAGADNDSLGALIATADQLFLIQFKYTDPVTFKADLLRIDATQAEPTPLLENADIAEYGYGVIDNTLYFYVTDDETGESAVAGTWISDGTVEGTRRAADQREHAVTVFNGKFYFIDTTPEGQQALWVSDNLFGEAQIVVTFNGTEAPYTGDLAVAGSHLYFLSNPVSRTVEKVCCTYYTQLWRSDGTAAESTQIAVEGALAETLSLHGLTTVGDTLFFGHRTDAMGEELWRSDGTPQGTQLVKDVNAGTYGSFPFNLVAVNDFLYFGAYEGEFESDLSPDSDSLARWWRSDGIAEGTVLITTAAGQPIPPPSAQQAALLGDTLYFTADIDGNEFVELWSISGESTVASFVTEVQPNGHTNASAAELIATDSKLFFIVVSTEFEGVNYTIADWLWQSDGTAAGTTPLSEIALVHDSGRLPGPAVVDLVTIGETAYVLTGGNSYGTTGRDAIYRSDGTAAGTARVSDFSGPFAVVNDVLFFAGFDEYDGESDSGTQKLWRLDNAAAAPTLVADINPASDTRDIFNLTAVGDRLYFAGNGGEQGLELWQSDGTAAGTALVRDLARGAVSSEPSALTAVGNRLFFSAYDGYSGRRLWVSDGSQAGTFPFTSITQVEGLITGERQLFFQGNAVGGAASGLWSLNLDNIPLQSSNAIRSYLPLVRD